MQAVHNTRRKVLALVVAAGAVLFSLFLVFHIRSFSGGSSLAGASDPALRVAQREAEPEPKLDLAATTNAQASVMASAQVQGTLVSIQQRWAPEFLDVRTNPPLFDPSNDLTVRWSEERHDPQWSSEIETFWQEVFDDLDVDGGLLDVSCRETLCLISMEVKGMHEARSLAENARAIDDERWMRLELENGVIRVRLLLDRPRDARGARE